MIIESLNYNHFNPETEAMNLIGFPKFSLPTSPNRDTQKLLYNNMLDSLFKTNQQSSNDLLPLRKLRVYIEIFSNKINISETCYSYLEKLGAKVERRMNKKCNLVIWKEGSLKTIEKAKEYNVVVVNSLWVEDCIENFHCADFEKFQPDLPNEQDLPFLCFENRKKKRRQMESIFQRFMNGSLSEKGGAIFPTSARRQKKKRSFSKVFEDKSETEDKKNSKKKQNRPIDKSSLKQKFFSQLPEDLDESLDPESHSSKKIKTELNHNRIRKKSKQFTRFNSQPEFNFPKENEIMNLNRMESQPLFPMNESTQSNSSFKRALRNKFFRKDVDNSTSIKNMILRYASSSDVGQKVDKNVDQTFNIEKVNKEFHKNLEFQETQKKSIRTQKESQNQSQKENDNNSIMNLLEEQNAFYPPVNEVIDLESEHQSQKFYFNKLKAIENIKQENILENENQKYTRKNPLKSLNLHDKENQNENIKRNERLEEVISGFIPKQGKKTLTEKVKKKEKLSSLKLGNNKTKIKNETKKLGLKTIHKQSEPTKSINKKENISTVTTEENFNLACHTQENNQDEIVRQNRLNKGNLLISKGQQKHIGFSGQEQLREAILKSKKKAKYPNEKNRSNSSFGEINTVQEVVPESYEIDDNDILNLLKDILDTDLKGESDIEEDNSSLFNIMNFQGVNSEINCNGLKERNNSGIEGTGTIGGKFILLDKEPNKLNLLEVEPQKDHPCNLKKIHTVNKIKESSVFEEKKVHIQLNSQSTAGNERSEHLPLSLEIQKDKKVSSPEEKMAEIQDEAFHNKDSNKRQQMNNQKEFQNISIIDLEEKENESILIEENFDTFQVNLTIPIFGEMEEESIQKNHEVEGFEVVNQFKDTHLLLIQNETVICENHIENEALKVNDFLPDLIEIESFSELECNPIEINQAMQHMNFEEKNEIPLSKLVRISPEIIILDDEDDEIIEEIGKFIPSEIRNELNEGVQKDNFDQSQVIYEKKKLDPNTKIIFADFESVELLEAKAFCENFGLQYIEENISNLSDFEFVVCPFNQLPKGYTLAFAMLQGKTILRKEWIEDSLINNEPQDIESYKIIYNNLILKELFSEMRFYLDKEFDKERINTLGKNELTTLIEGAGGIVRIFKGNSELFKVKDNIRICDFLVLKKNSKKKTSTPPHVKTIILQWIFDSLIEGKLMNNQNVNYVVV